MDWDKDGKKDLAAGDTEGSVWFFHNVGTRAEPKLAEGVKIEAAGKTICGEKTIFQMADGKRSVKERVAPSQDLTEKYSKIHIADWDGDGLDDILVGYTKGQIIFFRGDGEEGAPSFAEPSVIRPGKGIFPGRPSPYVVDWDGDGKKDLLLGGEDGKVYFFPNTGGSREPRLGGGQALRAGGEVIRKGKRARIDVADWNNDGKPDLLLGNFYLVRNEKTGPDQPGHEMGGNVWLFLRK